MVGQGIESKSSILQSTFTMAIATTLARITGFFRTWAMAFALGNTVLASAYQIAFNVPSMLFELVAGGILTTAFLPVYLTVKNEKGKDEAWRFASSLFNILAIALGLVVILSITFAPQVIATQTFTSGGELVDQAIYFFRYFAIQILFLGIHALVSGLLNANRKYFWPNISAAFNNLVVIATFFGYVPLSSWDAGFANAWLALGTTLGSFVMLASLIPGLFKIGISYTPKINFSDPALRDVARIALPVIVFTIANLVAVSFRNAYALEVASNGPSTIQYAWMWYQLPYGIVAAALSVAMFTELSECAAQKNWIKFKEMLLGGIRLTLFLIAPLAACLMALAEPLVSLYHAGEFTADDIQLVARVLFWWGMTLPLYAVYMYLYRVFSAMKDLVTLTKVDVVLRIFNIGCYAVLTSGFGSFEGFGLVGIPIADTIFYLLMNCALVHMLKRRVGAIVNTQLVLTLGKISVASAFAGVSSYFILQMLFGSTSTIAISLCAICVCGVVALVVYGVLSKALHVAEFSIIAGLVSKRKAKKKID